MQWGFSYSRQQLALDLNLSAPTMHLTMGYGPSLLSSEIGKMEDIFHIERPKQSLTGREKSLTSVYFARRQFFQVCVCACMCA